MATALAAPERQRGVCRLPRHRPRREKVAATAQLLRALADPTRLEMVAILRDADAPVCVCDFTAVFELSQPTVSHHMAKLREAGLVESEKRGIWSFYSLRRDLPAATSRLVESLL